MGCVRAKIGRMLSGLASPSLIFPGNTCIFEKVAGLAESCAVASRSF